MRVSSFLTVIAGVAFAASLTTAAAQSQHQDKAHSHPEAAAVKNPTAATPASVAAGKKLYATYCSECHGDTGKGDGMSGEGMDPMPSNFTDDKWDHGSTDGEIFAAIKNSPGPKSGMRAFGRRLNDAQIWDLVNYVRSLKK